MWSRAALPLLVLLLAPGERDSPPDLAGYLEKRIQEVLPTPAEKALDRIGWAGDLREARRLARELGRPIFLFTHDGRINTGRC